jgi:hypothetical protein
MLPAEKIRPHKECVSRIGPCAEELIPFETSDALHPFAPSGMTAQFEHDESDDIQNLNHRNMTAISGN